MARAISEVALATLINFALMQFSVAFKSSN